VDAGTLIKVYSAGTRDFSRANLRGADLRDANLWWIDLEFANLSGADLVGANLSLFSALFQSNREQNSRT
jgi:uncharacterized protein YjbI with pentapeptide repeats